jgi:phosphoribosylformylglycinamidine synthase
MMLRQAQHEDRHQLLILSLSKDESEEKGCESRMKARVFVTLKNGVLDPQGKAIGHALNWLGFSAVGEVRQGKVIDIELAEPNETKARAALREMCEKLLANTVIEKYDIELEA